MQSEIYDDSKTFWKLLCLFPAAWKHSVQLKEILSYMSFISADLNHL